MKIKLNEEKANQRDITTINRANMECKNNKRGITLIALVVTIVVLLILAGITINMILSEDGIISKARDAGDSWNQAEQDEQEGLNSLNSQMENILNGTGNTGGNSSSQTELPEYGDADKSGTAGTLTENAEYTKNGKTAIIPKGFKVSEVAAEQKIDDGLVIKDEIGNEFVWIPVDDYSKFNLIEGYFNGKIDTMLSQASDPSREAGDKDSAENSNKVAGSQESKAMYQSVKDNKGFYIARYEAGIAGTTASTTTDDENKQIQDGTKKPVSKEKEHTFVMPSCTSSIGEDI